jgi:cytochrome c
MEYPLRMLTTTMLAALLGAVALAASGPAGEAARGERLLVERGCAACHGTSGGGGAAPALAGRPGFTPTAMAASMWSHAAVMFEAMKESGVARPTLSAQEAADIHAFLSRTPEVESPRDPPRDPARGREVFEAKLCQACHEPGGYAMVEIGRPAGGHTPFTLIASLWAHGNGMLARMVSTGRQWQTLSPEETASLLAYLNATE